MSKPNPMLSMALAAGALLLVSALGAYGQVQSSTQQACLNKMNKDGAAVAKEQGKEGIGCLKSAGKGIITGPAVQACVTADAKGKVGKKKAKTTADETKSCTAAPNFGYTSAVTVNTAAQQAEVDLLADIYGSDLGTAAANCTSSKPACLCQQKISKSVEALAAVKLATFNSCKKLRLKQGFGFLTSAADLQGCVTGVTESIAADPKGKIAKTLSSLNAAIVKSCDGPAVSTTSFPGNCTGLSNGTLGSCLDQQVECRVCTAINAMDGIFVNCDLFDDGVANASCASGTGPTPTPTPTLTPTPTVTSTPDGEFGGAIALTSGLWNYDAVNGLPGGELECNDHFPTSHVCEYSELVIAEGNGELVGATDVNAVAVTSFWAVDHTPGVPTDNTQCISTTGTIRWFYATAHTASNASFVNLDNGTGALGALNSGTIECSSAMKSVGCCY